MGRQALGLGQAQGSGRQCSEALRTGALDAHPLYKVIQSEAGGKARGAAGWQDMV